jgi:putative membrane protein
MQLIAHGGEPLAPHDLWASWNADPMVVLVLVVAAGAYRHGTWRRPHLAVASRTWCFWTAMVVLAVALVSPLDSLAGVLASAHMVQHLLLGLVAAPLLVVGRAGVFMAAGLPAPMRRAVGAGRRRLRRAGRWRSALQQPAAVWMLGAAGLWVWHAAVLYEAALGHALLHAAQHATFLFTGLLLWSVVLHATRHAGEPSHGHAAVLVFTTALYNVVLAALLTFATAPWYHRYVETAPDWGFDPLVDQQLAGAIMWVPAGLVYVGTGVALVAAWVRRTNAGGTVSDGDWPSGTVPMPSAPLDRRR